MKIGRPADAIWLAALAGLLAMPGHAQPTPEPQAKVSPLLRQVLDRVVPTAQAPDAPAGLFRRAAQQHAGEAQPGKALPKAAQMVPALGYAMEQLDPHSFAVLRPVPVGGSGARLSTGDVFVLQFSTSLPGQVRLESIDAKGGVTDLGLYTVFVDQLNRLPRDKGIQLQGQPGLERLRFYFYPCLPAEAAGKAWAADFKGRLPACAGSPALQTASAQAPGSIAPRALVNLAQPDAHLVFAGSNDYQPGEVTLMEAQIRHEGRRHAP